MAALEAITADQSLQRMYRSSSWTGVAVAPADDVQRHSLMRVAAKAADLALEISGVEGVAKGRRGPEPVL